MSHFSRNSAEHRQDIRGVCCLKPHRWQLGEILTWELIQPVSCLTSRVVGRPHKTNTSDLSDQPVTSVKDQVI